MKTEEYKKALRNELVQALCYPVHSHSNHHWMMECLCALPHERFALTRTGEKSSSIYLSHRVYLDYMDMIESDKSDFSFYGLDSLYEELKRARLVCETITNFLSEKKKEEERVIEERVYLKEQMKSSFNRRY